MYHRGKLFSYVTIMGGVENTPQLINLILSCINTRLGLIQDQDQDWSIHQDQDQDQDLARGYSISYKNYFDVD